MIKNDQNIKEVVKEALSEVFGESDNKDPEQMKILVRRIPILCANVENMHQNIADIKDDMKWVVRLIIGAVILAGLAIIFNKGV